MIPFLGLLDDLLMVPLGISFTMKLIPEDVLAECQEKAGVLPSPSEEEPKKSYTRTLKLLVWIVILVVIAFILYTQIR